SCAAQKCLIGINPDSVASHRSTGGPYTVSRPLRGETEYIVSLRPELDQYSVAQEIACRLHGKVGYIYSNFKDFTLYGVSESDIKRVAPMPEVISVAKSVGHPID